MATAALGAPLAVPGPRPWPVVGGRGSVFRYIGDPIGHTRRLFAEYGPVVALAAGGGTRLFSPYGTPPGTVFVYGPELIRQVRTPHGSWDTTPLTGQLYPVGAVPPRKQPLKHFLVWPWATQREEHRAHRRLVLPAMHRQRVAAYRGDMVAIARSVFDGWRVGDRIDVARELRTLAARVATKTLFGQDLAAQSRGAGRSLQEAFATLSRPATTPLPYDVPRLPYRRFLDLLARFDGEMRAIIEHKRAAGRDDGDILSTLIQARDEDSGTALTEDELLGWVGTLFAAGHETAGLAMGWTLLLLSQHPRVAADLQDELEGTLRGDVPSVEQLGHLPLLAAVIQESMRLIPPAPFTWRLSAGPMAVGAYEVPAGTEVYASIYQTHHMPELYPEPERFDPRRWETIAPDPFAYLPFGAGPRMCVGAAFAMTEIKLVLAMLLQRFRLQFQPQTPVDRYGIITTGPKRGLPMLVCRPDRRFDAGVGGVRGNVREMVELPA